MLTELGPVVMNATGGLMRNPFSWSSVANLLVIEAPAGVGYSYCASYFKDHQCHNTDNSTAAASAAALQVFFTEKFPELRNNEFFIFGESYGGVYCPTLAHQIVLNNQHATSDAEKINLKSISVGDGCIDGYWQRSGPQDALGYLPIAYEYGFVREDDYQRLVQSCTFHKVNYPNGDQQREPSASDHSAAGKACTLAWRRYLGASSYGFSPAWARSWLNNEDLFGLTANNDPTTAYSNTTASLNSMMATYMLREDVREALHVTSSPIHSWPGPTWNDDDEVQGYGRQYAGTPSMLDIFRELSPHLTQILVYNGDTDAVVYFKYTREAMKHVYPEAEGGSYRPWFFNKTATAAPIMEQKNPRFGPNLVLHGAGVQFGGHVVDYDHGVSFATVHGGGHMTPQVRPQSMLNLLRNFVAQRPLTPRYPPEQELLEMSGVGYEQFLVNWTVRAQSPPYV